MNDTTYTSWIVDVLATSARSFSSTEGKYQQLEDNMHYTLPQYWERQEQLPKHQQFNQQRLQFYEFI